MNVVIVPVFELKMSFGIMNVGDAKAVFDVLQREIATNQDVNRTISRAEWNQTSIICTLTVKEDDLRNTKQLQQDAVVIMKKIAAQLETTLPLVTQFGGITPIAI